MINSPYTKWLWDGRRTLPIWAVGVMAVAALYGALWQSIDSPEMRNALHTLPQAVLNAVGYGSQLTPAGYLTAQVYGLVDAVVLLVLAITAGANIIAGEETKGRLELMLAQPVGRTTLAMQRLAALATVLLAINIALAGTLVVVAQITGLDGVTAAGFAAMAVHMTAFTWCFAAIAFAVGAATGSHAIAVGVAAAAALVAFFANGVLPQVGGLEWTQQLSAFHWLTGGTPLLNGIDIAHVGLLLGIGALIAATGAVVFSRRDIRG